MEFKNIIPPTAPVQPPIGGNTLWRFLSHLSLNYLSMADTQNLKELLNLYIFPEGRDKAKIAANLKRVEGINDVRVTHKDRLVSGHMMRGQEIRVSLRQDHFAGPGDMYLFSSILDHFLAGYASINCFTRLFVRDTITGEIYQWQPRIGDTPLV
jgi:type VI secretion system protein ImpG